MSSGKVKYKETKRSKKGRKEEKKKKGDERQTPSINIPGEKSCLLENSFAFAIQTTGAYR